MITILHEIWLAAGHKKSMNIMSLSDDLLYREKQAKQFWSQQSQFIPLRFIIIQQEFCSNILMVFKEAKGKDKLEQDFSVT